jgi:hypothetical protein
VVRGAAPGCSLHPGLSSCGGGIRTEIAPEVADDPELAARLDDLLQLSDKAGGADFTAEDADRLSELAGFTGATLDAFRAASRSA